MKSALTIEDGQPPRSRKRIFVPSDFDEIIQNVPSECPLVGGQAVAWWAAEYSTATDRPLTSCDIAFWGFREDLQALAAAVGRKPIYPHKYEMTAWVGGIPLRVNGEETIVEFINSIPGLDVINPEKASAGQVFSSGASRKNLLVLSPVSLVLAKLHALKAYDQNDRQDELHLKVCLLTSHSFLVQLLREAKVKQVLWNIERLIAASQTKPYLRLQTERNFNILSAAPIEEIASATASSEISKEDRQRLEKFLNERWSRLNLAS
jgi:hypothetical protein